MKEWICFISILAAVSFATGCGFIKPYSEDEVITDAKEYYGEEITYTGSEKSEKVSHQEQCTDYHFTSEQGFDFTVKSGVSRARKWIFLVIDTPFMDSDYLDAMVDYYEADLAEVMRQANLDAAWEENEAGRYLRYTITDESQIDTAANMLIALEDIMGDAMPTAKEDLPVSLVESFPIYGYCPVEQDEVGIFWGDFCSIESLDAVTEEMRQQFDDNYTSMNFGSLQ